MIVNKPQFDINKIKPGQAYWLEKNVNGYTQINTPSIIKEVLPLAVSVQYFREQKGYNDVYGFDTLSISIEEVATENKRNKVTLKPMKVVEE